MCVLRVCFPWNATIQMEFFAPWVGSGNPALVTAQGRNSVPTFDNSYDGAAYNTSQTVTTV